MPESILIQEPQQKERISYNNIDERYHIRYQQKDIILSVHHAPKCMSCHKALVVEWKQELLNSVLGKKWHGVSQIFVKFLKFQNFCTVRKVNAWIVGNFQILQFPVPKIVYLIVKGHWRVFCVENIIYKYNIIYVIYIRIYIIYMYYIHAMCPCRTNQHYWTSERWAWQR